MHHSPPDLSPDIPPVLTRIQASHISSIAPVHFMTITHAILRSSLLRPLSYHIQPAPSVTAADNAHVLSLVYPDSPMVIYV